MQYVTRRDGQRPANEVDLRHLWQTVEALQVTLNILTRDLVAARRAATVAPSMEAEVKEHETAVTLITTKLVTANLAYYEGRDSALHAPPQAHGHSH